MIGKHIWYLRLRDHLSVDEVSERSGIPAGIIHEYEESGITQIPNADLAAIAKAFSFRNAVDYVQFLKLNGCIRKFRLYALGLPKTGTVSLHAIFSRYRSGHEFWQWDTNQHYIQYKEQSIDREALRDFLLYRDAAACLEMDSSYTNRYYLSILADEFPDARFICLIREPISWVGSHINYFMDVTKEALQSARIDNGFPFDLPLGDVAARRELLNGLDHYIETTFRSWANACRSMLIQTRSLPPDRYLYLMTDQISTSVGRIAGFAGISESELDSAKSHCNKAIYQTDVLTLVPKEIIRSCYDRYCRELFEELKAEYDR